MTEGGIGSVESSGECSLSFVLFLLTTSLARYSATVSAADVDSWNRQCRTGGDTGISGVGTIEVSGDEMGSVALASGKSLSSPVLSSLLMLQSSR